MGDDRARLLERLEEFEQQERTASNGRFFRTGEVATILRVSVRAVRSWAEEGKIDCVRTSGGHRLFPPHTVRAALRKMEGR